MTMESNQRQAYRFDVSMGDQMAVLKTGKAELSVRLLEKSSGGYGVLIESDVRVAFEEGQIALLATVEGCQKVRIARVELVDTQVRLGLERMHDVRSQAAGNNHHATASGSRKAASKVFTFIKVLIVFIISALAFAWGMTHFEGWIFQDDEITPTQRAAGRGFVDNSWQAHDNPKERERKLEHSLKRLQDFSSNRVAFQLKLTNQQQQRISQIIEQAAAKLSILYQSKDQVASDEWSRKSLQQINDTWQQIENLLNDEQKAQWNAKFQSSE